MWDFKQVRNVEYRGEYVYHILFDGAVEETLTSPSICRRSPFLQH